MSKDKESDLFSAFTPPSYEEWKEAAEKSIKGKPLKKLIKKNYEGVEIKPIYTKDDLPDFDETYPGFYPYDRNSNALGDLESKPYISQKIPANTPEDFNEKAKKSATKGQNAFKLALYDGGEQPIINDLSDLEKALKEIDLARYPLNVNAKQSAFSFFGALFKFIDKSSYDWADLKGGVYFDPLALTSEKGALPYSIDFALDVSADIAKLLAKNKSEFSFIGVDTSVYKNGGCDIAEEIAFALAAGTEYLRELSNRGVELNNAAKSIKFIFAVDSEFFPEIAKFKTARILWAKIVKEFGDDEEAQKMNVYAKTAETNKSNLDPYVNLLRFSSEALSCYLGGANSMEIGYFDDNLRPVGEFSARVSRNIQNVILEECNVADTIDPAKGSYYIEYLIKELSEKSWQIFKEIEKKGGMRETLKSGYVQDLIKEKVQLRLKNLTKRKDSIIGVNKYPNIYEEDLREERSEETQSEAPEEAKIKELAERLKKSDNLINEISKLFEEGETLATIDAALGSLSEDSTEIEPIPPFRKSEVFELLRSKADEYKKKHGEYVKVFIAAIGHVRTHKARADFIADFFAVGGFETIYEGDCETTKKAAEMFGRNDAQIAVICSTDDKYPELVPKLTKALKEEKSDALVALAGNPRDKQKEYEEAGVNEFIYMGANAYDILSRLQNKINQTK